jgi:hypothetical protein
MPTKRSKSPREKKADSYKRDRRNTYGESPHGSRKSIPRARARDHREARRVVRPKLIPALGPIDEASVDEVQTKATAKRHARFKKLPDAPLGVVVERKLARRSA